MQPVVIAVARHSRRPATPAETRAALGPEVPA